MQNTLQQIEIRTQLIANVQTSPRGIQASIRLFAPGNTGMVVDLSHRTRAITANDMAGVAAISLAYKANTIALITDARINFNFTAIFPDAWVCQLPTQAYIIEEQWRFAIGFDTYDSSNYPCTPYVELAKQRWYQDEGDFYSCE
ncbi:TPA: hypothetical protein MAD82_000501 [Klebsiella pneumoniae]|nr:hypothetical protein [Klebsiella pneumoniae]HBS2465214.1 hypothetical protein [Klebsiella pneumoniae]HBS2492733.1 hypothetical protein [Klebsiella pneumoniae]HBS2521063.1 hypothetical protein [Klebsiella pneumoniae]